MVYSVLNIVKISIVVKYFVSNAKFNKKSVTFAQKLTEKIETNQYLKLFNLKN